MIESYSEQFAQQYRGFLTAITGSFAQALDTQDPTTPKARRGFREALIAATESYMRGFEVQLSVMTQEVRDAALADIGASMSAPDLEALTTYLEETADDTCVAMRACLYRDDLAAERELRKIALNVDLLQMSTGISKVGALIKVKFGRVRNLEFVQPDRLGRNRASDGFVKTMIRRHMLLTDTESRLFSIAKSGSDLAQVVTSSGEVVETISITGGTEGYSKYEDIKDTYFHPNSALTVVKIKE